MLHKFLVVSQRLGVIVEEYLDRRDSIINEDESEYNDPQESELSGILNQQELTQEDH